MCKKKEPNLYFLWLHHQSFIELVAWYCYEACDVVSKLDKSWNFIEDTLCDA